MTWWFSLQSSSGFGEVVCGYVLVPLVVFDAPGGRAALLGSAARRPGDGYDPLQACQCVCLLRCQQLVKKLAAAPNHIFGVLFGKAA